MSDNLRDRIAAALKKKAEFRGIYKIADFDYRFLADAVIAELQIDVEDGECNYCHAMLPGCRYSTWKADDE